MFSWKLYLNLNIFQKLNLVYLMLNKMILMIYFLQINQITQQRLKRNKFLFNEPKWNKILLQNKHFGRFDVIFTNRKLSLQMCKILQTLSDEFNFEFLIFVKSNKLTLYFEEDFSKKSNTFPNESALMKAGWLLPSLWFLCKEC